MAGEGQCVVCQDSLRTQAGQFIALVYCAVACCRDDVRRVFRVSGRQQIYEYDVAQTWHAFGVEQFRYVVVQLQEVVFGAGAVELFVR